VRVLASKITLAELTRGLALKPRQVAALEYVHASVLPPLVEVYPTLVVTSSARSYAHQARLWAKHLAGLGPLAAKPGHSYHELGDLNGGVKVAVDLVVPGVAPRDWQLPAARALKAREVKWHTMATERTWIHLQILFGGGWEGNPRRLAHW
jgi:hypothetical protein